jgi:hypothetical protein
MRGACRGSNVPRHVNLDDISYKKSPDFYVVSGTRGGTIYYQRCNFSVEAVLNCFSVTYPAAENTRPP